MHSALRYQTHCQKPTSASLVPYGWPNFEDHEARHKLRLVACETRDVFADRWVASKDSVVAGE